MHPHDRNGLGAFLAGLCKNQTCGFQIEFFDDPPLCIAAPGRFESPAL